MWKLFKKYYFTGAADRARFLLLSTLFLASIFLELLLPYLSGFLIDHFADFEVHRKSWLVGILFFLALSLIAIRYVRDRLSHRFRLKKIYALYRDCVRRLGSADYRKVESADKTFLNEQFISDSSNTLTFIMNSILPIFADILRCVLVTFYFLRLEFHFIWVLSAYYLICALVFQCYKKRFSSVTQDLLQEESNFYSGTTNRLHHVNFAMSNDLKEEFFGGFSAPARRMERAYNRYFISDIEYRTWLKCLDAFFFLILTVGYFLFGFFHLSQPGNLVILFGFFRLLTSSYGEILIKLRLWKDADESRKRLDSLEKDFPEKPSCLVNSKALGEIFVEDLVFSYDEKVSLEYPSFHLKRGVNIIRGANGSGKTTLLKLLMGLYDRRQGKLHFVFEEGEEGEGVPKYRYIPQEPDAFETTLLLIRFRAEISNVLAEKMQIDDILNDFEQTFHRLDGQWDVLYRTIERLSAGQRKKLMLLAGVADSDSGLIFLDEPENHLDALSKEVFRKHLADTDKILVIVSHQDWEGANEVWIDQI